MEPARTEQRLKDGPAQLLPEDSPWLAEDRRRNLCWVCERLGTLQDEPARRFGKWHSHPGAAPNPSRHGCDSKGPTPGPLHIEATLPHVHACQVPTRPPPILKRTGGLYHSEQSCAAWR